MRMHALWPGRAPGAMATGAMATGATEPGAIGAGTAASASADLAAPAATIAASPADQPAISVHLPPPELACGTGIIVCPGGGYRSLASDHEGLQVARWLNRLGIAAFVLRYRLGPRYHSSVSLLDGQRAIRSVRHQAAAFGISPQRIGMLGFSAGGHLTVACGTGFDAGDAAANDPIERESARPDFLVPVYAVVNGAVRGRKADEYTAADTQVSAATPPTFLMHTHQDAVVSAEQSLLFYRACLAAGVPAELHVFGHGEHGVGLASGDPDVAHWTALLHRWLRRNGLLTGRSRVAVAGQLRVDGAAPGMAWITLIPRDPNAPIARIRTDRGADGHFSIARDQGPVPGVHRVQVQLISAQHPYGQDGAYSLGDAREAGCEVTIQSDANEAGETDRNQIALAMIGQQLHIATG